MDAKNLIETLRNRGVDLRVNGDEIQAEAPQEPDLETKALLDKVRQHKEEILEALTQEATPEAITPPFCWNCAAPMEPASDIYGMGCFVCPSCEVSSEELEALPDLPRAWRVEEIRSESGEIRAVRICSALLQDHLWVLIDRSFNPHDGLAVYYAEELPALKTKTLEDLKVIHMAKLEFPGSWIIQDGDSLAGK